MTEAAATRTDRVLTRRFRAFSEFLAQRRSCESRARQGPFDR